MNHNLLNHAECGARRLDRGHFFASGDRGSIRIVSRLLIGFFLFAPFVELTDTILAGASILSLQTALKLRHCRIVARIIRIGSRKRTQNHSQPDKVPKQLVPPLSTSQAWPQRPARAIMLQREAAPCF